jgi:hypothetical protein
MGLQVRELVLRDKCSRHSQEARHVPPPPKLPKALADRPPPLDMEVPGVVGVGVAPRTAGRVSCGEEWGPTTVGARVGNGHWASTELANELG